MGKHKVLVIQLVLLHLLAAATAYSDHENNIIPSDGEVKVEQQLEKPLTDIKPQTKSNDQIVFRDEFTAGGIETQIAPIITGQINPPTKISAAKLATTENKNVPYPVRMQQAFPQQQQQPFYSQQVQVDPYTMIQVSTGRIPFSPMQQDLAPSHPFPPMIDPLQDRLFDGIASPASIVPKLFSSSYFPFFVPHAYFNLCPFVTPADPVWSHGCAQNPYPYYANYYASLQQQQQSPTGGGITNQYGYPQQQTYGESVSVTQNTGPLFGSSSSSTSSPPISPQQPGGFSSIFGPTTSSGGLYPYPYYNPAQPMIATGPLTLDDYTNPTGGFYSTGMFGVSSAPGIGAFSSVFSSPNGATGGSSDTTSKPPSYPTAYLNGGSGSGSRLGRKNNGSRI